MVEGGGSEIAVVEGVVDRPVIASAPIGTDEMIVVVSPTHAWAGLPGEAIRPSDSAWVLREPGSGTRVAFETLASGPDFDRAVVETALVLPSNEAVLAAVEAGAGATLVSRSAASAALRGGLLTEVDWPAVPRPFHLLRHKERYRSKAAAAFEALVRQNA